MSTTLELAAGELVTLAAGPLVGDQRITQLQVYGRLVSRHGYVAADVVVQLQPEELARLALELLRRLSVTRVEPHVLAQLGVELSHLADVWPAREPPQ